jgi:hypothetical protein
VSSLPTSLRKQLAIAIQRARTVAESGARNALQALAVHEADPYRHMSDAQRELRRKLRSQARQLGDTESNRQRGTLDIVHLVEKLAYDQWHRILFARYLLENNLLISPAHQVSVSLDDCEELAPSEGLKDAWAVAARYAAKELPEIFRADDPAGAVDLPLEDRAALVALVTGLPTEVFTASDSLGWCYQFWQAERKEAVNASGTKIGADELPSVTQLFTEDYMVDFLLDNTLGAWHAGKVLMADLRLAESATSEAELRRAVALPGCSWNYLRLVRGADGRWTPAAGTFDGWPKSASAIRALDPCMGSGHFVVAMFERLVALRLTEEALDATRAVSAVIRDNLFGLEIDPRCTQIAAFNLALAAWRRVGHCQLPAMNLACSGLAPNTREADWLTIAKNDEKLKNGMARLYSLFRNAPVLGSLINPRAVKEDLLVAGFHELEPALEAAFVLEGEDVAAHEMFVTARGLAKAAEILALKFTLVATNVPYLGRGKQDKVLQDYCDVVHPIAKADLATSFVERCISFCEGGGSTVTVTPQNWLFLGTYRRLRESLLGRATWVFSVQLGANAFRDMNWWAATTALSCHTVGKASAHAHVFGIDVTVLNDQHSKAALLRGDSVDDTDSPLLWKRQVELLSNPDSRMTFADFDSTRLLGRVAKPNVGFQNGDTMRFLRNFWELGQHPHRDWRFVQMAPLLTNHATGLESCLSAVFELKEPIGGSWHNQSADSFGKTGVLIRNMGTLAATRFFGGYFDQSATAICCDEEALPALWTFVESRAFFDAVRSVEPKVNVTPATFGKIPFDAAHWVKLAAEKYPFGLPKVFSADPTQWVFDGSPTGSDKPLHVAVARLLGYRWPRQTGSTFHDCPALSLDALDSLVDDDGIVPISPIKGEAAAAERLRELLSHAYGVDWNSSRHDQLLEQVDYGGLSLEEWLRNGFFEQHCAVFNNRPFIWHIWDGRKDGFSALVNYHKLTRANLEKLTFAYLGDWIRRQQAAVDAGEAGSDARLQAAKQLQARLKLILDGEPPFDLFVRWKPLSQQAIGWHPDVNDGVRMNIRPFMAQDIPGGKKGAGILRAKPNIKWEKDRGNEPARDKKAYPWFWGWDGQATDFAGVGSTPDGNRWNACHYTNAFKQRARDVEAKQ